MAVLSNLSMATLSKCLIFYLFNSSFLLTYIVTSSSGELQRFAHRQRMMVHSISWWLETEEEKMGKIGEMQNIDFVISAGDNFYDDGLKGVNDPAFQESFMNIYTAPSLQKQWYTVLGNHDYRGDVDAQLSPTLTQLDSRWLFLRSYVLEAEIVDFFFVDTSPFVESYFTKPVAGQTYDWRGVTPRKSYIAKQLEEVKTALEKSNAKWKIVLGHQTIRTGGIHRDTEELENNVDLYINGHDHCLQHITSTKRQALSLYLTLDHFFLKNLFYVLHKSGKLEVVTSGGGSKACNGFIDKEKDELTPIVAKIGFYDVLGQVLYNYNMYKEQQLHLFS
ncbi:hypothetical protein MKX01_033356 [Papaver californicum]|nr:hypothetical protein MKX01_033356 [Papaver californicum]